MLDINMEFRKGILFIRLRGDLTRQTIEKLNQEVTSLIKDNGIRNVLFNISEINNIDVEGFKVLFTNSQICSRNNGQILLCGGSNEQVKKEVSNSILKHLLFTPDELSAFAIIK